MMGHQRGIMTYVSLSLPHLSHQRCSALYGPAWHGSRTVPVETPQWSRVGGSRASPGRDPHLRLLPAPAAAGQGLGDAMELGQHGENITGPLVLLSYP